MLFAGLDLHGSVLEETTHCGFRTALVNAGAYDALLDEVCRQIENRAKDENLDEPICVIFSADHDAQWIKKGSKSMLGYKIFARYDEKGFVDKVHTTPANVGESP